MTQVYMIWCTYCTRLYCILNNSRRALMMTFTVANTIYSYGQSEHPSLCFVPTNLNEESFGGSLPNNEAIMEQEVIPTLGKAGT